ncbi:MAG: hypothetical protein KDD55_05020 [Bdellovibrionales bacterium]|nr:hypothetical protein [Bdellovibrionales bacterium]
MLQEPGNENAPINELSARRGELFTRHEAREILTQVIEGLTKQGAQITEQETDYYVLELDGREIEVFFEDENILKGEDGPHDLTDMGSIQLESIEPDSGRLEPGEMGYGFGKIRGLPGEEVEVTADVILASKDGAVGYLLGTEK